MPRLVLGRYFRWALVDHRHALDRGPVTGPGQPAGPAQPTPGPQLRAVPLVEAAAAPPSDRKSFTGSMTSRAVRAGSNLRSCVGADEAMPSSSCQRVATNDDGAPLVAGPFRPIAYFGGSPAPKTSLIFSFAWCAIPLAMIDSSGSAVSSVGGSNNSPSAYGASRPRTKALAVSP